jgi:hypothetical protein
MEVQSMHDSNKKKTEVKLIFIPIGAVSVVIGLIGVGNDAPAFGWAFVISGIFVAALGAFLDSWPDSRKTVTIWSQLSALESRLQ